MAEEARAPSTERLMLANSLLSAISDSVSSLQRLVNEVHREVRQSLREEEAAPHQDELGALRREIDQLREGMSSRAMIERAKGILMQANSLSEMQAFELLNEMSQHRRRKLREIAADVVNGTLGPRPNAVRPGTASLDGLSGSTAEDDREPPPEPHHILPDRGALSASRANGIATS